MPGTGALSTTSTVKTRADVLNERPGNLGELDCPICKNRGCVYEMRGDLVMSVECGCMTKRRALKRIRESGLADALERCTFDAFQTPEAWQKKAKQQAQEFAQNPGGWFVVTGAVGSGKTHLCTAVVAELLHKSMDVRYMPWRQEAPFLKALANSAHEYRSAIKPYQQVSVLYIDDLWKGTVTDADKNLAFALLDSRYSDARKITIISSERTLEEMLDIDEAIGSRINERARAKLRFNGGNWRLGRHDKV